MENHDKPASPPVEQPKEFTQSFDAKDWAVAFVAHVKAKPSIAIDEDTMLGWFANAIMRGYDTAKSETEKQNHVEAIDDSPEQPQPVTPVEQHCPICHHPSDNHQASPQGECCKIAGCGCVDGYMMKQPQPVTLEGPQWARRGPLDDQDEERAYAWLRDDDLRAVWIEFQKSKS